MITTQSQDIAKIFAALGDERRLAILAQLQDAETLSITSLSEGMGVTRQAVSKHLKLLAEAQLVSVLKSGREMHYKLEPHRFVEASAFLSAVEAKWGDALKRLQAHVE